MPSDQFERKLRQRLEGAELPPSPDLWAAIAEQVGPPPPKRRAGFWWWLDGSVLVLLAALWLWPVAPGEPGEVRGQTASLSDHSADRSIPPSADSRIDNHVRGFECQREGRGQTASLSDHSADRSIPPSADSRIDNHGRGLESQREGRGQTASLTDRSAARSIPLSPNSRISDHGRSLESQREGRGQTASLSDRSADRSFHPSAESRISNHVRGLESQREDRGQTASLSDRSADRSIPPSTNSPTHQLTNQPVSQSTISPAAPFTISALGPRQELLGTSWNHPAVSPQEISELSAPSPWRFRLGLMAGISPTANGWVWNSQVHEPDIRANYSRSLGANQVAEEEIHLFRLPNRKVGLQAAVEYQIARQWSLEAGLNWMHSSQGTYEKGSISGEQPIGPTVRDPFIEVENQYQFRLSQVEVPLQLHAHVYPNGQHWSVSAGLILGHNRSWQVQDAEGTAMATEDRSLRNANQATVLSLRPWYGQAIGQIQYYAPLRSGGEFYVGPIARYQLSGQYGGLQAAGQSRYLLGLQAGLRLSPQ